MGKRRTPKLHKWCVGTWKYVGPFKRGQRELVYLCHEFSARSRDLCVFWVEQHDWRFNCKPFVYRKGQKPRRIVELQVFPDE